MSEGDTKTSKEDAASAAPPSTWVKFDDETAPSSHRDDTVGNSNNHVGQDKKAAVSESPAVLNTESVHVNPPSNHRAAEARRTQDLQLHVQNVPAAKQPPPVANNSFATRASAAVVADPAPALRTIELSTGVVRQGFSNGDIVVTLLPVNTRWPWVTPAQFRPELVPEELMAQGLTLTVEEYVHAMELLVNDVRFTLYNVCYKRVLVCWIMFAFLVLIGLLFSGITGLTLFALGVVWLLLNAGAIFLCMWLKMRLARGLERCLARVNKQLMRHKLVVALDDRGRISCHKVNLCFMYLDAGPCIAHLQGVIEREEQSGSGPGVGWEGRMDVTASDIVIQGSTTTRLSRKQGLAEEALMRYLQRWGKDYLRRRLDWTLDEEGGNPAAPRHLQSALCPCQYVQELIADKAARSRDTRDCCPCCAAWLRARGVD